jgi:hypothetical protein
VAANVSLQTLLLFLALEPTAKERTVALLTGSLARRISPRLVARMAIDKRSSPKRLLRQLRPEERRLVMARQAQLGEARLKVRLAPPKDQESRSRRESLSHQEKGPI